MGKNKSVKKQPEKRQAALANPPRLEKIEFVNYSEASNIASQLVRLYKADQKVQDTRMKLLSSLVAESKANGTLSQALVELMKLDKAQQLLKIDQWHSSVQAIKDSPSYESFISAIDQRYPLLKPSQPR